MHFLTVLLLFFSVTAFSNSSSPLILRDISVGSDSTFNPLSHYLNLSFDTAQNPNYFTQKNYFYNHGVLWERVKNPFKTIDENGGYGNLLANEFFGLRAIPNYTLHLLGGGYDYRWLSEWYEKAGVPMPYLFAFVNSYLANIGNESIETTAKAVTFTDHVADLYFFDIAGKLLFLSDDVVKFTHDTLQMRAWHFQPMLNLRSVEIDNAASNYIFRPRLFGKKVRPFIQMGLSILAGVSFLIDETDSITVSGGIVPTDPLQLVGDPMAGIFWDRDDSLLASLTLNGTSQLYARLNVYPGVIRVLDWKTGVYLAYSKADEFYFGLSIYLPLGFSINI